MLYIPSGLNGFFPSSDVISALKMELFSWKILSALMSMTSLDGKNRIFSWVPAFVQTPGREHWATGNVQLPLCPLFWQLGTNTKSFEPKKLKLNYHYKKSYFSSLV